MTIVESTRPITGGVDTHLDVHVAAALDGNGGVLGVESFATTPAGYRDCTAGWPASVMLDAGRCGGHRRLRRRAGPVPAAAGVEVIEVDRPNRQERRRNGKSDQLDAIEAGRAAFERPLPGGRQDR